MRLITYYTDDPLYRGHFHAMRRTVEEFEPNLVIHARRLKAQDWVHGCALKGRFVAEMMDEYPRERLLWLDVDARLRGRLDALRAEPRDSFDIGCHISTRPDKRRVLISNVLVLEPTEAARAVVEGWAQRCEDQPTVWDQEHLFDAIGRDDQRRLASGPRVWDFGPRYGFIHDIFRRRYPGVEPIIEHYQASRQAKSKDGRSRVPQQ